MNTILEQLKEFLDVFFHFVRLSLTKIKMQGWIYSKPFILKLVCNIFLLLGALFLLLFVWLFGFNFIQKLSVILFNLIVKISHKSSLQYIFLDCIQWNLKLYHSLQCSFLIDLGGTWRWVKVRKVESYLVLKAEIRKVFQYFVVIFNDYLVKKEVQLEILFYTRIIKGIHTYAY